MADKSLVHERGRIVALAIGAMIFASCSEAWTVVHEKLPAALYSVAGTSASDVWSVGGDAGDGKGPLVLHFDGTAWTRLATAARGDLWWVHVVSRGKVIVGGAGGQVWKIDGTAFERIATPGGDTVFGVWVDDRGVIWAVGGDTATRGFAWKYDGSAWNVLELPKSATTLYKVWGAAANDVWLCGDAGVILHWDGVKLTDTSEKLHNSEKPFFTVHGTGSTRVAVGGYAQGVVAEWDGAQWVEKGPSGIGRISGVFVTGDEGWAVGQRNTILMRSTSGWARDEVNVANVRDLHAVWRDPDGGAWAVGGELTSPSTDGLMLHKGSSVPSDFVVGSTP